MFYMFYTPYYMFYDPTYMLVLVGVIISLIASARVKSTFTKYQKVRSSTGLTGAAAAEKVLQAAGIHDVQIQRSKGDLTDHYDPRSKILRLSDSVYNSTSVAAIGVAAHECGHAMQDQKGYSPLKLRSALVPVTNFGSTLSWPLVILGIFLGYNQFFISLGIGLFCAVVLFQLITLPVEFNASGNALMMIERTGILGQNEIEGARKVLKAAALTYVASALGSILQLLRLLILTGNGKRRD